jgi:hypothetical protein
VKRLDVRTEVDDELGEIKQDVAPEAVLDEIEATKQGRTDLDGAPETGPPVLAL